MNNKTNLLYNLPKVYRQDPWVNTLYNAIGIQQTIQDELISQLILNNYFDTMDIKILEKEEQRLKLKQRITMTLQERKAAVEAKWKSQGKITVDLLQSIANSWKNGETQVEFNQDGTYKVTFTGSYGIPTDLTSLKSALEEAKQPYIPINYAFKYLLINDIHNTMTITQLQTNKISNFAGGA